MRLIDADDFGNRMYHEAFEKDSDLQKWDSGCWIRYKLFENVLREQPTAQPECKPGRWIKEENRGQLYRCSACGNFLDFRGVNAGRGNANYCPNCGADMREENES